tara:strand:- start:32 stop:418 length:387 start_codon:yes stop_codon:yes gene_type:complete
MKYIFVSLIFFINFETMAKQISDLNWEKRVVIISFENKKEKIFLSSQKFIQENRCAVDDRNIQFIFFEKFKNTEFEMPKFVSDEFGIWLIGYDGSIKDYSKDDKIFLRLFNLIDTMPMRQNEMKHDKC